MVITWKRGKTFFEFLENPAADDNDYDEDDRGHWGSKAEFILSCVGFSVMIFSSTFYLGWYLQYNPHVTYQIGCDTFLSKNGPQNWLY